MNQECYNLRTDLRVITKLSPSYGGSISSNYISVRMIEISYPSMVFVVVSVHCYTFIRCFSSFYLTPAHNHNSVHSSISVNCSSAYYFTSIHCTALYCSNFVRFCLFLPLYFYTLLYFYSLFYFS
jgi:hypothetical protein